MGSTWNSVILGILTVFLSGNEYTSQPQKDEPPAAQSPIASQQNSLPAALQKLGIELLSKGPATKAEIAAEEQLLLDINGLVFEETMTKIGYEFYEYFSLLWETPKIKPIDYNILITEKASPIWGSWIKVVIDERVIWEMILSPRSSEVEDAVTEALQTTKEYLDNYELYQFETIDLQGSGI
jgi:curli production assembly/transport component CsgE